MTQGDLTTHYRSLLCGFLEGCQTSRIIHVLSEIWALLEISFIFLLTNPVHPDPDPKSGAFSPGMGKKSRSGSGKNIPDHISGSLETIFWVKKNTYKFFHADADPGWKKFISGINISRIRTKRCCWQTLGGGVGEGPSRVSPPRTPRCDGSSGRGVSPPPPPPAPSSPSFWLAAFFWPRVEP
jgi:hypothetical protein